ncbi:DUF421 domain-containing protein [Flavobacterium algicola]|uniref:DUF421 domain-containing protein n=1 Tax=Flavobacterium algicola TaxID=556529 RepID=UPI001EFD413A|nr:YetF domain-containing protein [Flavobacterium algicola]MCG9793376.1 DUF421 domain-containing protein [Flavobacterium algicola]
MENIFFSNWQSLVRITIITVIVYPTLIILLRVSGKRTLSKMNAFDLIITIALGSTFASVILNKSITLSQGILTFGLLILLQYIITYFSSRSTKFSNLAKASPRLVAYQGALLNNNMLDERINEDEIWAVLRKNGYGSLTEVDAIILETDGSLSVIKQITDPTAPPIKKLF